jgi:hypothetical protein
VRSFEYPDEFEKIIRRIHHVGVAGVLIAVHSVQEHAEEGEVSVVAAVGDAVDALHELDPSSPLYRTAEVLGGDPCIKHEGGRYEALSWLGTRSLVCPKPPHAKGGKHEAGAPTSMCCRGR